MCISDATYQYDELSMTTMLQSTLFSNNTITAVHATDHAITAIVMFINNAITLYTLQTTL